MRCDSSSASERSVRGEALGAVGGAILIFSALAHIGEADPKSAGWWWEWAICRGAIIFI